MEEERGVSPSKEHPRRRALQALLALGLAGLAAGCGFQLRGQAALPFAAAYVDAPADSALADKLRKDLAGKGKLAEQRDQAQVVVRLSGERREKAILSLSGAGKVREYRLTHKATLSAATPAGQELLRPAELQMVRDYAYSDSQALAKEAEEAMLRRDMDDELLQQTLRRLSLIRLP
jgi:LPS-assembly lipoprotein